MTPIDRWDNRLECRRCGNRYLPPWREGAFRCSACGGLLPLRPTDGAGRSRVVALLLSLALAGVVTVAVRTRGESPQPARETRALAPPPQPPGISEEERQRFEARLRAMRLSQLRRSPNSAAVRAAIAFDIYRELRVVAAQQISPSFRPPEFMDRQVPWPERQMLEGTLERHIRGHLRERARPGLAHAEAAVRLADSAREEIEARHARAAGLMLLGEYQRAIADYRWLETVTPGREVLPYARCFEHLGRPLPARLQEALRRLSVPPAWRSPGDSARRTEESLTGAGRLLQRWPRDAWAHLQVGSLALRLASEKAALDQQFPPSGRYLGAEADVITYRRYPQLVHRGIRHCRRALELARGPRTRAVALQTLGQGLLVQGRLDEAIRTLQRALAEAAGRVRLGPNPSELERTLALAMERRRRLKQKSRAREDTRPPVQPDGL